MIPKIIHYCWFGEKELPEDAVKCINSWKKNCPDYEIREWNESNFDLDCCTYVKQAYESKKWAFITDYVRLYAMVNYGGIYMDTDVEVVKPLDEYLYNQAFSGFQTEDSIPTGIMASEKNFLLFQQLLDEYKDRSFINSDGTLNTIANTKYITDLCLQKGLILNNNYQVVDGFALYPIDYFCAKSWKTGIINKTDNTVTIHHFAGSWLDDDKKSLKAFRESMIKKYGYHLGMVLYKIKKMLTKNTYE